MSRGMHIVATAALLLAVPSPGSAEEAPQAALHRLFESEWERGLRENPVSASYLGERRYDAFWPDRSLATIERSHQADRAVLAALEQIDPGSLPAGDQLNRELFRRQYQDEVDRYRFGLHLLPITQRRGVQTADQLAEALPFETVQDYENWLARLRGLGTLVDQNIELLRVGMERGLVQPRVIMERVPAQVAKQQVADPTMSPFYAPFQHMPDSIPAGEQQRLSEAAKNVVETMVVPAYGRLQSYLEEHYLPACRDTVGIWDAPGGEQWYQNRVEWFTTTRLTADEVHEIGLREVERIRGEMMRVIEQVGFQGDFQSFLEFLRTDPRFRYRDPQALLDAYLAMSKRVDPLLPRFFGRLPRMPYGVRPIPEQIAPDTTTAYYQGPSMDGRRAGYYYVNLYRPEQRPTYEIPVLTIHEAVPGHHLQIALAQELGELPKFRRDFEATAFVEGWALYSESLGEEMGLYEDPYDKFGQLTYEMWRAVRLVVDTGMHHKRWTRQQAIDFFKANAAKTELDIVNEIDRYISWPGQALAYKIGELRIKELRRYANEQLGPSFDLRAFHDIVLGSGAVPLDVLEATVRDWVAAQAASTRTGAAVGGAGSP
ncbi:MAG TPA: DUF885 domain-containing protein [Steroidobacteraceae bacterium]|nr:DUF885 domain-containing protein [Steroidobacteraceae bacterium]